MDLIEKICDPVIVMAEGSVLFEGKDDEELTAIWLFLCWLKRVKPR